MSRAAVLGSLAAIGLLAGLATAQAQTDAAKAMVGAWELSNADRDRTCTVNFKLGASSASYPIELDRKCQEVFPAIRAITAWTFGRNDNLLLVDAAGKPMLELLEVEAGMFEGLRPNEGRYFLQNAAVAAASRDRPADDLFGEWAFVRGGTSKPICAVTLANEAADTENFKVTTKPGCDQLITRFGPTAWRMDRGQLVLQSGKGEIWRFEENDPTTWDRIPKRQPLSLVRQDPPKPPQAQ